MRRILSLLSPLVHLSNNWLSLAGVVIVTTATVFWLFLLPVTLRGEITHPYVGILVFLLLPAVFFTGLILIPLGIRFRRKRDRGSAIDPASFPALTWANLDFRRLVTFIGITTVVNIVVGSQLTYGAVDYMDSVSFCGLTCHTVMQPEYTGHQNSAHARVACAACHIGPGASWFVRSKLSGTGQLFAVMFNSYPRPIPAPVQSLRPARDTCEGCHWPQRFDPDKVVTIPSYADDAANTLSETVLLVKIGGRGRGIHGVHVGEGVHIRYASDETRQTIPWVEYGDAQGRKTAYTSGSPGSGPPANMAIREMDCVDCHNRPTHTFQLPDRALDNALAAGLISPGLPFVKKQGLEILKRKYATSEEAAAQIPAALTAYYQASYPAVYQQQAEQVRGAALALLNIYDRNVFPAMKVTWGTYPNNIGHTDFPGCFRCHDGSHMSAGGKAVTQDCGACHNVLAMQESNPKILTDLGLNSTGQ